MASRWGVSRSVAQIHALTVPGTIATDRRRDRRNAQCGPFNVSVSIKELQAWDSDERDSSIGRSAQLLSGAQGYGKCSP